MHGRVLPISANGFALLLHSDEEGSALVRELGQLAAAGAARGVPARVLPLAVHHVASVGLDLWLAAVADGAAVGTILNDDAAALAPAGAGVSTLERKRPFRRKQR